jgi:hypothetical protein
MMCPCSEPVQNDALVNVVCSNCPCLHRGTNFSQLLCLKTEPRNKKVFGLRIDESIKKAKSFIKQRR